LQFVSLTGVTEQAKLEADAIKKSQAESASLSHGTADDTTPDESSIGLDSDDIKKALGENATEYLIPQEAGHVLNAQHQAIPEEQILKRLPQLQSALLRLHVVRRGKLQRWTIYHFGFMYPKLLLSDGKILPLIHDQRPH
jgi:hypothetical protein